jgi:hypothetical protein
VAVVVGRVLLPPRQVHLHVPGTPRHGGRDPPGDFARTERAVVVRPRRGHEQRHTEQLEQRAVLGVEVEAAAHRGCGPRLRLAAGEVAVGEVDGPRGGERAQPLDCHRRESALVRAACCSGRSRRMEWRRSSGGRSAGPLPSLPP